MKSKAKKLAVGPNRVASKKRSRTVGTSRQVVDVTPAWGTSINNKENVFAVKLVKTASRKGRRGALLRQVDVLPVWRTSISNNENAFAVKIAKAAPELLDSARNREVRKKIYSMIGETLQIKTLSVKQHEAVADALMRAVLRSRDGVPTSAQAVIRAHRSALKELPNVWRYIGSFVTE